MGERADISIMKDVTSTVYNPGDAVRYFISYQNIGPSNSNDVTIEDSIPPELTNVQASINSGAAQAWNSPYSLGTLKPADSGYIIITGTLAPSAFGEISNTASIQSSTLDANLDDNAHTVTIEVTPSADVSVIKTASPASVKPNDVLTYSIVVKNAGPADAQNVVLADTVPDKLTNVEFSIDGGAHFAAWHSPYMMGTIGSGTSKTILIRGTVAASATETIQNTATVSTSTKDTDLTNNTSSTVTKLSCAPRYQAITDIIQSVALEQTALAHILNAEGEKIQKVIAPCTDIHSEVSNHLKTYDFVYNGDILYYGIAEGEYTFVVFALEDTLSAAQTAVYCFDVSTYINVGDHYIQEVLKAAADISETDANRIRNILLNAFPYIPIASVRSIFSMPTLTQAQAVTATQLAIWKLTNNFTLVHPDANVMALYEKYLALPPLPIIIEPAQLILSSEIVDAGLTCGAKFVFRTDGLNSDGSPIVLSYTLNKDIVAEYGAVITQSSAGGVTTVTITNLPVGATFSLLVSGVQTLPQDAYRYVDAQDLVGLFTQTQLLNGRFDFTCNGHCSCDILAVNNSVRSMVNTIAQLELVLQNKLAMFEDCDSCKES